MVGGGAVPVPFAGGRVDGVAGADLDDLAAAGLDQPDALGDVQGLPERVGVPGVAGSGGEADGVDPDAGGRLAAGDDVVPDVAGEPPTGPFALGCLGCTSISLLVD